VQLRRQLRCSIKERVECLNIKHGSKWWTKYKLLKLMRVAGISRKKVQIKSVANKYESREKNDQFISDFFLRMKGLLHQDFDLCFVDETSTTIKGCQERSYYFKGIKLYDVCRVHSSGAKNVSTLAAVSARLGKIHAVYKEGYFDSQDVLVFFKELNKRIPHHYALVMDNASIHSSKVTKSYLMS
jgi:hypothetical protein